MTDAVKGLSPDEVDGLAAKFRELDVYKRQVAFSLEGVHAHDVAFFANERGLALRAGHHCAQPLMRKLGSPASSRASFYLYNTEEEVQAMIGILKETVAFFRG